MASARRVCRFYLQTVDIKHAAGLFTPKAVLEDLPGDTADCYKFQ